MTLHAPETIAQVLRLYGEQRSIGFIADTVGLSRGAVHGLVERGRIRGDVPASAHARGSRAERIAAAPRTRDVAPSCTCAPAALEPLSAVVAPPSLEAAIGVGPAVAALEKRQCRWPIGDIREPSFRFCCARVTDAVAPLHSMRGRYCAAHLVLSRARGPDHG